MKYKFIYIFLFISLSIHANKDRLARPISFKFVYSNNEEINLINPTELDVKKYSEEIINHEKNLSKAIIIFETGEELTFEYNGTKWTSIKIKYKRKNIYFPENIIEKIPEINFESILLVWSNEKDKAFKAYSFYIEFDIGIKKAFDKLQNLQISFEKRKFANCVVLIPNSDKSIKYIEWK